ncbi:LysR family transcriptional regulator [uncultured Pseudomonas sp.]|uniref:LysR family transcriptional regulator n=1 Tax=uncultured Pseudomonas sp. TaxID=114707 RepID=UPI0025EBD1D3|nr:LysR family transcriptional regulator [uncultured Pseudomonas sp.]
MLDLRKLRYFLTVAEELHFGRAALRLHLAQPPLTRQISAMEAELGFRLFDRTSRTVTLTPQGRSFLPYARAVLEQVELAQVMADKLAAGRAGQLALGYASSIALSDLFSQALQAFAQRFADVQLTLVEGASVSQWSQIADGRIDIGMSRMQPPCERSDIQSLSLGDEPLVAAISSDSPLAAQAQVTLAELSEHPLILFPADYGSGLNEAIEQLYRRDRLPVRPGPSGRQITSIIALVAAGQGVALVPRCAQALAKQGVTYRPLADPSATAPLLVLTRKQGRSQLVDAFMGVLDELLQARAPAAGF